MKLCTDIPVTCKIRTGWSKNEDEAHNLIEKVLETNVAAITLHGRSRVCRYTGLARWDYIGQCSQVVRSWRENDAVRNTAFLGNGDVFHYTGRLKRFCLLFASKFKVLILSRLL